LKPESSFVLHIAQSIPPPATFPAERSVSSTCTARVSPIGTTRDHFPQRPQIAFAHVIAGMVEGFVIQSSTSRFFVDGDPGEITSRALNDLERYLIGTAIGGQFDAQRDVQDSGR
jgi:hypothetical protein